MGEENAIMCETADIFLFFFYHDDWLFLLYFRFFFRENIPIMFRVISCFILCLCMEIAYRIHDIFSVCMVI